MTNEIAKVSGAQLATRVDEELPGVIEEAGGNAKFVHEEFFAELDSPHTITAYRRNLHRFLEHVHTLGLALHQITPNEPG